MTTPEKSALRLVYEALRDALTPLGVSVRFGEVEAAKRLNQGVPCSNRVVIDPTDNGKVGSVAPAIWPGSDPAPLGTLRRTGAIYVWSHNPASKASEDQDDAITALWEEVFAVIHNAFAGAYELGDIERVAPTREQSFGVEWRASLTVAHMLPDEENTTVLTTGTFDVEFVE